jgi:hypothetical protein
MISKIEVGATGARFPSIERLAQAVDVDPAELFTSNIPGGSMSQGAFGEISAKLSPLGKANGSRECAPDDRLRVPTISST